MRFLILLTAVCGVSCIVEEQSGLRERELTVGGAKRTYRIHLPAQYDGKKSVPVVTLRLPRPNASTGSALP